MTIGLELVSERTWSDEELRAAVSAAWAGQGRGRPEVTGEVATNLFVEVAGDELELQVFRPHRRTTQAGPRWVTTVALAASSSDELVAAVLDVAADLARRCGGFVLVDGGVVELAGVPAPDPAALVPAAPDPDGRDGSGVPPHPPVFATVMFDAPTPGEEGWRSLVAALGTWVGEHREWLPRWWRPEEEWEPFDPEGAAPDFWPLEAWLSTGGGVASWTVVGAGFAHDVFAQVDVGLRAPVDTAADLLAGWGRLEPWSPAYAMVHPWHDSEPFLVAGLRQDGAGDPELVLSGELLAEGLPQVYWGNLLGAPWVTEIGADRIASAPVHRVEEVLPGRWVLQLTERPSDVLRDPTGFAELRERVKEHLGAHLFRQDDGFERRAPRPLALATLGERGLVEG